MTLVFLHVCCVLSGAFSQAEWTYVRREQYCFKSPELTATNIRVKNSFSMLPLRKDRLCKCKQNIEARSRSRCCCRKAVRVTCFTCVCNPGYPAYKAHAQCCGLSGSARFLHIISQRQDFRKKVIERELCVLIFCTTFVWNVSHSRESSVRYKCTQVLVSIPVTLVGF